MRSPDITSSNTRHLASRSLGHFLTLVRKGLLHSPKKRIGMVYAVPGKGKFSVFRETANSQLMTEGPVVLVVGFRLKRIGSNTFLHWCFQRICIITTPFWSGLPGFYIKLWMVDPSTKNYLGIYEWKGAEKARIYLNALIPVLHFFSIRDSVWYKTYPDWSLREILTADALQNELTSPRQ